MFYETEIGKNNVFVISSKRYVSVFNLELFIVGWAMHQ